MTKALTARLRDASANHSAMCPFPMQDVLGALEAIIRLKDLTGQIKAGRLTDELGHDFRLNDAYMRAVDLLAQIEGDEI